MQPLHFEGLNCFEDAIVTQIASYRKDYKLLFFSMYGFRYFSDVNSCVGGQIRKSNMELSEAVQKVFNIKVISQEKKYNIEEIVEKRIFPLVISADTFWCPWHRDYQKIHHIHYIIIYDFIDKKNLLCIDPAFERRNLILDYNTYVKGHLCNSNFSIERYKATVLLRTQEQFVQVDYKKIWKFMIEHVKSYNLEKDIGIFIYDLHNRFNFREEYLLLEKSITDVYMDRRLGMIGANRELFCTFIDEIEKHLYIENLNMIKQEFIQASRLWKTIVLILRKCYYTSFEKKHIERIEGLLLSIIEKEKKAISSMRKCKIEYY